MAERERGRENGKGKGKGKGNYVSPKPTERRPNETDKEYNARMEKMRLEKLKMASYCPKVSGLAWSHLSRKD